MQSVQPLILLCGLLCDETVWGDVPERVADIAAVQIVSFQNFSTVAAMAAHVLSLAPDRFALAGHSMGGRVALETWRCAAPRITGLALMNTGVHPTREVEYESRAALVRLAQTEGMAALAARWLPPMMGAAPLRTAELMPALTAMIERDTPESFAGQISALLQRPDARPVLETIDVPTLLVSGSNDNWSSVAQHADMQRQIRNARLVEIPNAGHMAPIERPDAVARAVRGWLSGLAP